MSEAMYAEEPEVPSVHQMGARRELDPEVIAWRKAAGRRKELREAMIHREREKRKEKLGERTLKAAFTKPAFRAG